MSALTHGPSALVAARLVYVGYCRVSCKHKLVSRIDRPDWREYMAKKHAPWDAEGEGMKWVRCLGSSAADHYRRVYSQDTLTAIDPVFRLIPGSMEGAREYLPLDREGREEFAATTSKLHGEGV